MFFFFFRKVTSEIKKGKCNLCQPAYCVTNVNLFQNEMIHTPWDVSLCFFQPQTEIWKIALFLPPHDNTCIDPLGTVTTILGLTCQRTTAKISEFSVVMIIPKIDVVPTLNNNLIQLSILKKRITMYLQYLCNSLTAKQAQKDDIGEDERYKSVEQRLDQILMGGIRY